MLTVQNLSLRYPSLGRRKRRQTPHSRTMTNAITNVTFDVEESEFLTLLGPSGCGKSTTLRCVAGLETPDEGEIVLRGETLYSRLQGVNKPTQERGLGMVFQSYAIWPHMNVERNVSFPLLATRRRVGLARREISERTLRALETVGLRELAGRSATKLSGGQQQRLALARALASAPPLLLLDEPLSNLDANLREAMRIELKRLQESLGLTVVYVTHDQAEALSLSTRIAVMEEGSIVQIGSPRDIYDNPVSEYVANFVGTSSIIPGIVISRNNAGGIIRCSFGELSVDSVEPFQAGDHVKIHVRPEHVNLYTKPSIAEDLENTFEGRVITSSYMGDRIVHLVHMGNDKVLCSSSAVTNETWDAVVAVEFPRSWIKLLVD